MSCWDGGRQVSVVYFTRQGVTSGDVDAVSSATQSSNKGMEGSDTQKALHV